MPASTHYAPLLEYLKSDRLGRFFYPGFHEFAERSAASTRSRWNAATIYANLLLWKPLSHVLANHGIWGSYAITLVRDEHPVVGKDRWTLSYEDLCAEYNKQVPAFLAPVTDDDIDPRAKSPISLEDLRRLFEFCQTDVGKKIAPLRCDMPPHFMK